MSEVRKKKIKHAVKIHREGRIFVESCLIEMTPMYYSDPARQVEGRKGKRELIYVEKKFWRPPCIF